MSDLDIDHDCTNDSPGLYCDAGAIYGPCSSDLCEGACAYHYDCDCDCHAKGTTK